MEEENTKMHEFENIFQQFPSLNFKDQFNQKPLPFVFFLRKKSHPVKRDFFFYFVRLIQYIIYLFLLHL